jgi:hypothetical protein
MAMTYPGQGDQRPGEPQQNYPGQPNPQYGQPQYGQQPDPRPQYGQPQYGQPQAGHQPHAQMPVPDVHAGPHPGQHSTVVRYPATMHLPAYEPPQRKRNGLMVGAIVAVIALAAGGLTTWLALDRGTAESGSASAQDAVAKLATDIRNNDQLGLINDLAPGESSLVADFFTGVNNQLKRLQVEKPDADSRALPFTIHSEGIKADTTDSVQQVNDHLEFVSLTGKLSITANPGALNEQYVRGATASGTEKSIGITRIGAVEVGRRWYPSLIYSMADAILRQEHQQWPVESLPPVSGTSADDAVRQFVQALLDADFQKAIEMTVPDEMGALHDAGPIIVNRASGINPTGLKIIDVTLTDQVVPGGVDVVFTSITLAGNGGKITVARSNGCWTAQSNGNAIQPLCASNLTKNEQEAGKLLPPTAAALLDRIFQGVLNVRIGIVATERDGHWYISPGETLDQLTQDLFDVFQASDLQDIQQLIKLLDLQYH